MTYHLHALSVDTTGGEGQEAAGIGGSLDAAKDDAKARDGSGSW